MLSKEKITFLKALENGMGIITNALEACNVPRAKYLIWYNNDEEFSKMVLQIQEKQIDFVESKLLEKINNGDTQAILFYLKTKGKDRGYTEKPQIDDNKNVVININALLPRKKKEILDIDVIENKAIEIQAIPEKNKDDEDGEHKTKP
jgi:hypothetical protein